jgi:hypothetical protein
MRKSRMYRLMRKTTPLKKVDLVRLQEEEETK